MDDRVWKNLSIGLGVVCALLIGVAAALMIVGHKGGAATATPTTTATTATEVASVPTDPTKSLPPSPGSSPTVSGPTHAPGAVGPATIEFSNLALDSEKDPLMTKRTFTYTSDGGGAFSVATTQISKSGYVRLCYKDDDGKKAVTKCVINGAGKMASLSKTATAGNHTWTVTIVGYKASKPTVSIAFTWPTSSAVIKLSDGRFQGTSGPSTAASDALGGITAIFRPRAIGALSVDAVWTLATTDATMTLLDTTSSPALTVEQREYQAVGSITPKFTANVDPTKKYQVKLVRTGSDSSDRPDLTCQISFP